MQGERDELANVTFPALRRRFRERGVEVFEVDLRWGVSEADVTLEVCLAEVNRCKPFFVGLIGQRYGTVLTESELTPELRDAYPILRDGIGRSLTEIEILQGVLADPESSPHAMFFERDKAWLNTLSRKERPRFEEVSRQARAKLGNLRARLRRVAEIESYQTPADVGPAVEAALVTALDARFPEVEAPDDFTQAHRLHAAYARDRLGPHVGAEPYLQSLDQWMREAGAPALLITGASGGGKSKLIAKWMQARRTEYPGDILFAHYLGASPESAEPIHVVRRLWEHLNRATGEIVDLPSADLDPHKMSADLAQRLAQASRHAVRRGVSIVIALDGLDKLARGPDLRWLPEVLAPQVKLIASSLAGDALNTARARHWRTLEIAPLDAEARHAFIARMLHVWGKRDLSAERKELILGHALAGLPLFLKTVLDELRVSATEAQFDNRLGKYVQARDMPDLFARVLQRFEHEYGEALTGSALSLIWAGRGGLEEAEIIAITGATPVAWAKLRNGLADLVRDHVGRLAFSHDYLRSAVGERYLATEAQKRAVRLRIADHFATLAPSTRQLDELPFQLLSAGAFERLKALLTDFSHWHLWALRGHQELLLYWSALRGSGMEIENEICNAFEAHVSASENWTAREVNLADWIGSFLHYAKTAGERSQRLAEQVVEACRRTLGADDSHTLAATANLAQTLKRRGEFNGALKLFERVLDARTQLLGRQHPETIACVAALAEAFELRGDFERAQKLHEDALAVFTRLCGPEHPDTLASLHGVANCLHLRGDYLHAQKAYEAVLATEVRLFGWEHRKPLSTANNLALALHERGDVQGAAKLRQRVLDASMRLLGREHPDTLTSVNNLAQSHEAMGDLETAQRLYQRVFEARTRVFGEEHPETLASTNNLAACLYSSGDLARAQELFEPLLKAQSRLLGAEHPNVLSSANNLALTYYARGDLQRAQQLFVTTLQGQIRVLGPAHPNTLATMLGLAQTLYASGDLEAAQKLQEKALDIHVKGLGAAHPQTLTVMNNLASTMTARGKLDEARDLLERVVSVASRVLGPEQQETVTCMSNLAGILFRLGQYDHAHELYERVLEINTRQLGAQHPFTRETVQSLAAAKQARAR